MQGTVRQKSGLQVRSGHWRLPITHRMLRIGVWRGVILQIMGMRISKWLIGIIGINALITCTSVRDERSQHGNGGTAGAGEGGEMGIGGSSSGGNDDAGDALVPPPAYYYDGPVYDGDTSCKPDGSPYAKSSCCEGVPCNGVCELHGGQWQCTCYGVEEGCAPLGLVCCKIGAGCTAEAACQGGIP